MEIPSILPLYCVPYFIISTFIFTLQGYRTGLGQRANSNSGLVLFNALVPHGSLDSDGFFGQPQPHHEQQQQQHQFVSNFDDLQNAQPIPAQNHHHQQQQHQQQNHSIQNGRFQQQQQQQQRDDGASGSKEYVSGRR